MDANIVPDEGKQDEITIDKLRELAPDVFELDGCTFHAVGSRTIYGAARDDSDYDLLVISKDPIPHLFDKMGFEIDAREHYEPSKGGFNSWRRNELNVILTYSRHFGSAFRNANALCVCLGLTSRDDRVAVFQAILYGNYPNQQLPDFLGAVQ